ncbi:M20 family metallo-hydrolase [Cesiribacter sp. SM1]|uniref:M20 family metallo-hydrolase n=1 Tax=Cesiribacter sp. SM1 TaxID=2861196 RepID=UPI001CD39556|nr:M20 family metallo-hydrolase [Cesiribacter sp. SM1]
MPVEDLDTLHGEAVELLKALISTPSFSREEGPTADLIEAFLRKHGQQPQRQGHNVWCVAENYEAAAPILLLNSHHDTVKPVAGWTKDPFEPLVAGDTLYGLGSNDAGASAVSLLAAFLYLSRQPKLPYKLIVAITAEEEVSGQGGVQSILPLLGEVALAVVGEPTSLDLAIAERGLMVLDCVARGRAGHAARNEGDNAIYKALADIEWFRTHQFSKTSEVLGPVKMSVTQIQAGTQHNVVPDECRFVVDVRTNECYRNVELLELIRLQVAAEVTPRSTRLNSSGIAPDHPLVQKARSMGMALYGSPTLSDQALMPFPSVKLGPGDSARSHTANEYIRLSEIKAGIARYIALLEDLHF